MNYIKHIGIYTKDVGKLAHFYKDCFNFKEIIHVVDQGELYDELLECKNAKVEIIKMISEHGEKTGIGEMIELIEIKNPSYRKPNDRSVSDIGLSHISISAENIEDTVNKIIGHGGKKITKVFTIGQRKCCFCSDIESNIIELIE